MSKPVKECDLIAYPFEEDLMLGRKHIRDNFTAQGKVLQANQEDFWKQFLVNLALGTIKWNNVPAGIDTRAIEYILLFYGCGGIFTEQGGHLFAQASYADNMNLYYNPNEVLLTAPSGQTWYRHCESWVSGTPELPIVEEPDCAVVWDNMMRVPFFNLIDNYARRIAKYDAIADINIEAQRTPWVIVSRPEGKRNASRLQAKLDANDQYLKLNDEQASELPYVLQTNAPFVADKIHTVKHVLINEVLTLLGVDNSNVDKKERVQTSEVLSNNEMIMALRESRLKCRQQFCERANTLFGLDMSVEWGIEGTLADMVAALQGGGFTSAAISAMQKEGEE